MSLFSVVNGITSTSAVSMTTSGSTGNFSISVGPLAAGTYTYLVEATNSYGTTSSSQLTFTIKTQGPTTVPTLGLNPRDVTGAHG